MWGEGVPGCWVLGWWSMGMWRCRVGGVWGGRMLKCSILGHQDAGIWGYVGRRGNAAMLAHQDVRMLGCRNTAAGRHDAVWAPHLQCSPEHSREAGDGKGSSAMGWLLTQAQLTQQLPHHWCQLEPMACGKEEVGGHRPDLGAGRCWVPSPTREASPNDDVAVLGMPVQDEVSIRGVLGEPWCEDAGPGVLSWTHYCGESTARSSLGLDAPGGHSPCRGRSPPRLARAPARAGSC